MSEDVVARFCPQCNARVRANARAFDTPQTCPKCGQRVRFVDPASPPPEPPEPPSEQPKNILDHAARVCAVIGILAAVGAVGSLSTGNAATAAFLAFLLLSSGIIPLVVFFNSRAEHRRAVERSREAFAKLSQQTDSHTVAVNQWMTLKANFDTLLIEEKQRLRTEAEQERDEARQMFRFAEEREQTIDRLGKRLLSDVVKTVGSKLTSQNYSSQKSRLQAAIDFCRKHEYEVPPGYERELLEDLRQKYEKVLRVEHEKAEQARIKAQIREEQRAEKELTREMQRMDAEQRAIEKALAEALKKTADEHSAEVEALRAKLLEAEEKAERAKSMAQLTKSGHIYVISNIGSFGEGVFKVGMTRRLTPTDRVKELGDASVPFPFDVHMMISCDDAPGLENTLHKALHRHRVNRVNIRKEFFRVDLETIRGLVESHHGEVDYTADAEALEYRETMEMSDDDFAYVSEAQVATFGDEESEWESGSDEAGR